MYSTCRSNLDLHFCSWHFFDNSSRFWDMRLQSLVAEGQRRREVRVSDCLRLFYTTSNFETKYLKSVKSYQKVVNNKNGDLGLIYTKNLIFRNLDNSELCDNLQKLFLVFILFLIQYRTSQTSFLPEKHPDKIWNRLQTQPIYNNIKWLDFLKLFKTRP